MIILKFNPNNPLQIVVGKLGGITNVPLLQCPTNVIVKLVGLVLGMLPCNPVTLVLKLIITLKCDLPPKCLTLSIATVVTCPPLIAKVSSGLL